ncbi:MAG: tetratricopeptide repeat protein [Fimbriimonas sp.]
MIESATRQRGGNLTEGRQRPFFNVWRIGLLALFLFSILVYWPALDGQAIWDDHSILSGGAIGDGTLKGALTQPFLSYFRPGASLSFLLDRTLYGADIFGFHLTSILLHAIAVVLISWLGLLLFESVPAGLLAGLAFAVQPAQVGGVAWVGGRIDALSCVLVAMYLCWLVLYCRSGKTAWLWLSVLALVAAAFTKEQNAALGLLAPFAMAHYGRPWKASGLHFGALAIFAVTWLIMNPGLHKAAPATLDQSIERVFESASHYGLLLIGVVKPPLFTFSLLNYDSALGLVAGAPFIMFLLAGLITSWRARSVGIFLVLGFLLAYLPVSNLIPIPSLLVAPYRVAVPGVFLALALGWAAVAWPRLVAAPVLAAVLITNALVMRAGIQGWATELGFFEQVVRDDPHSLVGRTNYLAELMEASRPQDALRSSEEILDWIFWSPNWRHSEWLVQNSRPDSPAMLRVRAIEGADEPPAKAVARILFFRSVALDGTGQDGLTSMLAAEQLDPENADVLASLGDHYLSTDRPRAIRYYERSVKADPKDWENVRRLAKQRLTEGDLPAAENLYRQTVTLAPLASIAWFELSICLERRQKIPEAIEAMRQAEKGFSFDKAGFADRIKMLETKLK